ncbi:unnamed protein product [Cochlearia groenlandica]
MQKERREMSVSSNRSRVSPYPIRSCRNKKQKEAESSPPPPPPVELENVSEWEDVRCVICMEPPHNAVLLQCSSFTKGCRAYMCDTSARHSNCFKQYRRNNNVIRCNGKSLHCPYCRGEVNGTTKSTSARRFMNARIRCCSVEKCGFSGTYSQLKTHSKAKHPCFTPPKVSPPCVHNLWEHLERDPEFIEMMDARRRFESEQRSLASSLHQHLPHRHPMIDLNLDAFMHDLWLGVSAESQVSDPDYAPELEFENMYASLSP